MNKELALTGKEEIMAAIRGKSLTRITNENWQTVWQAVQVRADMGVAAIQELKTPEISTINRGEKDTEKGIALYEFMVLGILEFFGAEWSNVQIRESAELLFSEYYWLHIAELKHLITRIKTQTKVYGKFNPAQLMEAFNQYADESLRARQDAFERQANDERYDERWGSHDARLKADSEAYTMNGLITHEKSKLKADGGEKRSEVA